MNKEHFNKAVTFGRQLITTGDLDPVYIAVYKAGFDKVTIARWMLAYSCLYHLAASVYLARYKGKQFWDKLEEAAVNKDLQWPRGSERRHWRGHTSVECVAFFRENFQRPEEVMTNWALTLGKDTVTCSEVFWNVKCCYAYGDWIAFKVADLLERVAGIPVDFSKFELGVYSEPRKGAALLWTGDAEQKITDAELRKVVDALLGKLGNLKAPPAFDRYVNIQECETILCKYKSRVGGHYPPGKDTLEVLHGLTDERFQCAGVKRMLAVIAPMVKEWR